MSDNFHGYAFWEISLHIFEVSVSSTSSQVLKNPIIKIFFAGQP